MTVEESKIVRINSLEECKKYFIEISRPDPVKHIEDFHGMAKYDYPKGRVGLLLKKYITNPFGFDDNRYYYLVFRSEGWFYGWAGEKFANVTKYRNQPGCSISAKIYSNMLMNEKYRSLGAMTIGFSDGSFRYIRCRDFIRFIERYDTVFEVKDFQAR